MYFDEKFSVTSPEPRMLPFFHSCDACIGKKILIEKKLMPSPCRVFRKEKLLYFFYGRPAYKSNNPQSSGLRSLLPMSFIFNVDVVDKIKRIAPFDTGAFKKGLYRQFMNRAMKMDDFFLTPDRAVLSKGITYFFSSNEHYFQGEPREKIDFEKDEFEIESYYALIRGVQQDTADDRKASFEVQTDKEIELTPGVLDAVIMPHTLKGTRMERMARDDLKAEVITYRSMNNIPSNQYYGLMLYVTRDYLIDRHAMSDD